MAYYDCRHGVIFALFYSSMSLKDDSLRVAEGGKWATASKVPLDTREQLALVYTPGVAEVSKVIVADLAQSYRYTSRGNIVAIISDGSAVLGLGNIGPEAAMPVMEGKALLFKRFVDIDAIPLVLATQETEEIIATIKNLAPSFGAINLEDISAPRCFEIEERLKAELTIPIMHDDQHGTAIVVAAALLNALRLVDKKIEEMTVVINGSGAAGVAIARLLVKLHVGTILVVDTTGIVYQGRLDNMNVVKQSLAEITNREYRQGSLSEAMKGADVFIGVSKAGLVDQAMVRSMAPEAIVFAMANPDPEILPTEALAAGAAVVGTGRSDFPNQINNALAFPGVFKGTLMSGTKQITDDMKLAAVYALVEYQASVVTKDLLLPSILDSQVHEAVAQAVAQASKVE